MLGAIAGDIIGSPYEWDHIKTIEFPLFTDKCRFTDDTVMTFAVAEALMSGGKPEDYIQALKKFGRQYLHVGYSRYFRGWLVGENIKPLKSKGIGSAMRVSPVGWWFDTLEETEEMAEVSAAVTHNHPEGIKGARATAAAIFLARSGKSKKEIKTYIEEKYEYKLSRTLEEIRPTYVFNATCQGAVPEAIIAFLESTDFEFAVRNAVSLGGDSDSQAAIAGAIAEAAYGVPDYIVVKVMSMLDEPLKEVLSRAQKSLRRPGIIKDQHR